MKKTLIIAPFILLTLLFVGCANLQPHINTTSEAYSAGYNDAVNGNPMAVNIASTSTETLTPTQQNDINQSYQTGYNKGQQVYQQNQTRNAIVNVVKNATIGSGSKTSSNSSSNTVVNGDGSTTTNTTTTSGTISW